MFTEFDRGWLVGILEGEGAFCCRLRGPRGLKTHAECRIEVVSTDASTTNKLYELLGGRIYGPYKDQTIRTPHRKWCLQKKKDVATLLEWSIPYFGPRRQLQAQKLLTVALLPDRRGRPKGIRRTDLFAR